MTLERQRMTEDRQIRQLSPHTQRAYLAKAKAAKIALAGSRRAC